MTETAPDTTAGASPIDSAVAAGLEETNLRATPMPATSVDAAGTERVVAYPRPWTPAPVEPAPADVARMQEFERVREHQAQQRQELLRTGTTEPATGTARTEQVPGAADPGVETAPAQAEAQARAEAERAAAERAAAAQRSPQEQQAAAEAERQRQAAAQQAAQQGGNA